ncbi:MAG: hypothetical protein KAX37_04100, partial [Opitutaceae bacterium]|nr:hypothetical protein [Opitutaceae bacterium]
MRPFEVLEEIHFVRNDDLPVGVAHPFRDEMEVLDLWIRIPLGSGVRLARFAVQGILTKAEGPADVIWLGGTRRAIAVQKDWIRIQIFHRLH